MNEPLAGTLVLELADVVSDLTRRQRELLVSLERFRVNLLDPETGVGVYRPPPPRFLGPPPPPSVVARLVPFAPAPAPAAAPLALPPPPAPPIAPPVPMAPPPPVVPRAAPSAHQTLLTPPGSPPKTSALGANGLRSCVRPSGTTTTSPNSTTSWPVCPTTPRLSRSPISAANSTARHRCREGSRRSRDLHDPHTGGGGYDLEFLAPGTGLRRHRLA